MIFGYARVSTNKQNFGLQIDAFLKEGIDANLPVYVNKSLGLKKLHGTFFVSLAY